MASGSAHDVGAEIRAEMGRQRVSMLKLSGRTNIARTTLAHQINSGRVTVDTLVAIAKALGKEPADFLPCDPAADPADVEKLLTAEASA